MNEKDRLTYSMGFLFIFFLLSFAIIIMNEKINMKKLPDAKKKITTYVKSNYKSEFIKIGKTEYITKCSCFKTKVTNKKNKDLYFTVTYKNKKLSNTYNEDYKKGRSLLNKIEKDLTKDFQNRNKKYNELYETLKIKINKNLDDFNPSVKEEIINSTNYKNLNIYEIEGELIIDNWTFNDINSAIIGFNNAVQEQKFNPTAYDFYITNPKQSGESFKIEDLKVSLIKESILNELIPAIKDNKKEILKKYNY